jgi:MtfA peptidase
MPFDTTYHIQQADNNTTVSYTATGGTDTSIYLSKDQIPPGLYSFPDFKYLMQQVDTSIPKQAKKEGHYKPGSTMIITFIAIFIFVLIRIKRKFENGVENISDNFTDTGASGYSNRKGLSYLVYYGDELNFADKEVETILTKRFQYFTRLSQLQQKEFIERLQNFIANKVFKIHDGNGYKEMPILISAAAIQLTFGLKKYLLPNFEFIHVYPQEFMRIRETICFLQGNVSGHTINLSWKHFLEGYAQPDDGQNVGLHELAHALYYQTFVVEKNADKNFRDLYDGFINDGNKAFHTEKTVGGGLYSEYAVKNFQEFWAESVEIFFEKPAAMKGHYPKLYETIKFLLNQDPYNKIASVPT